MELSFRTRLALFFLVIVVVPMVALVYVIVQVNGDSKTGKADARLAASLQTAEQLYRRDFADSRQAARRVATDPGLDQALRTNNQAAARAQAARLLRQRGLAAIRVIGGEGSKLAVVGTTGPIGVASVTIRGANGSLGTVLVSAHSAHDLLREVAALTGLNGAVLRHEGLIDATVGLGSARLPANGRSAEVDLPSGQMRARGVGLGDAAGGARIVLFGPPGAGKGIGLPIVVGLVAFFAVAFLFTTILMRSLGGQHQRVSEEASTDALTGLANRRRFRDLLGKEVGRARRFEHPLSLMILDIDDFKRVNDTYGHPQGDEVLRNIARVLREESREVDEPARYGGEEMTVILPETGPIGATEVAERVRTKIEATSVPLVDGGGEIAVTASIGIASIPASASAANDLIAAADEALYTAKRNGKNRTEQAAGKTGS